MNVLLTDLCSDENPFFCVYVCIVDGVYMYIDIGVMFVCNNNNNDNDNMYIYMSVCICMYFNLYTLQFVWPFVSTEHSF